MYFVNDYITQIDNHNAYKMNIDEAIRLLDGTGGTKVNVQTFRNNNYYNYTLVRADLIGEVINGTNSQDSTAESIGIKIDANEGWLWVRQLIPGYPAESAGILVGDYITKIGDESAYQMKIDDAVKLLNTAASTIINIQTYRNGKYYNHSLVSKGQYSDQNLF